MKYLLLEKELKKRVEFEYFWGRKQADDFDKQTNFIYKINSFETVLLEIETKFKDNSKYNDLKNYALNRWFNFWSATAVEYFFCEHEIVKPYPNLKDKFTDFFIDEIPFDHKTTVFPKGFNKSVPYAIEHKNELIEWLYQNQSQQQRKHFSNRIFIVLVNYEDENKHWKLKSELSWLQQIISTYLCKFDISNLYSFTHKNNIVKADVIWAIK
ncbi:MAG: hypothetical protein HKP59_12125 [Lutibacter sp.]|uniref:hypothetical protein n=1 Tax=Lutibacter sp. TaxID=1925666 RepID=UPI0017B98623|nr:hypothetical protein [Lutibacter sp.]MBT8318360.1 hypothetical protein [Lutibacter sp.]NNJ59218.1 hypothetical protein [Lutibacter sp.]